MPQHAMTAAQQGKPGERFQFCLFFRTDPPINSEIGEWAFATRVTTESVQKSVRDMRRASSHTKRPVWTDLAKRRLRHVRRQQETEEVGTQDSLIHESRD